MTSSEISEKPGVKPLLVTNIFVSNIHCSGCVKHLEDVLRQSSSGQLIRSIDISLMIGEIILTHDPALCVEDVCKDLSDAAFEVAGATTSDDKDNVVSELHFEHAGDGLLEDATEKIISSLPSSPNPLSPKIRSPRSPGLLSPKIRSPKSPNPLSPSGLAMAAKRTKRKRHVEHCIACQEKEAELEKLSISSSSTDCDEKGAVAVREVEVLSASDCLAKTAPDGGDKLKDKIETSFGLSGSRQEATAVVSEQEPAALSFPRATFKCELSIGGMTCSACTNAVTDGLNQIDQVRDVSVNLMTNSAVITFSGTQDDTEKLVEAVEDLGFEASVFKIDQLSDGCAPRKDSDTSTLVDSQDQLQRSSTMTAKLSIVGMTCSACTNTVTDTLSRLPFVRKAVVHLMTHSAEVVFEDEENVPLLVEAVEDLGFDCSVDSTHSNDDGSKARAAETQSEVQPRQVQILIDGFYCETCPGRVTESLQRHHRQTIEIISEPTLKHPVISVKYTPDRKSGFTVREVLKAVEDSDAEHFSANIYHPPSIEERSRQVQLQERRRLLIRLVISAIIAIPTLVIGVVLMDLLPSDNSTRQYLTAPAWAGNVPRAQWALWILATPVYIFAADVFHKRAIKEVRHLWSRRSRVPIVKRLTKFGSMNLLVSAGTTVAYVSSVGLLISDASTPLKSGQSDKSSSMYFDTVVFLTFFILVGRFLEAYSKSKAGDAISMLGDRKPQEAILIDSANNHVRIGADMIELGDRILVPHGQSPAADGILADGDGLFDESSLTGESRSVKKQAGDKVFTGTINVGSPIEVTVNKIGGTSMLDQIINVVREGQTKRAPVERIADMITGYFVPVITALAIITFVIWVSLGYSGKLDRKYLDNESGGWAFWSLEFAIAVFVVACPCGIGLAAPTALFVGGGLAAKHGILARGGGQAFQDAGSLDAIVFDKTGTLTEGGDLKVTNMELLDKTVSRNWVMNIIYELEALSAHPIAVAVAGKAKAIIDDDKPSTQILSKDVAELAGKGMEGTFATKEGSWKAKIGSPKFIGSLLAGGRLPTDACLQIDTWEHESKTVIALALLAPNTEKWSVAAILAIEDAIRPSARPTVEALQKRGLEVYMLTGDNWATARAVASRIGIRPHNVFANVLPTEKADKIEWLQNNLRNHRQQSQEENNTQSDVEAQKPRDSKSSRWMSLRGLLAGRGLSTQSEASGPEKARVAFVGDGINDAPALTKADISISPSNGAPIATNSCSFILMAPTLLAIPKLFDISTKVFRRVRLNFAWALVYNVVLVPVAAGVFFKVKEDGFRLGPVWGSLAMALSSVSVVTSSLLLRWETPWPWQWYRRS